MFSATCCAQEIDTSRVVSKKNKTFPPAKKDSTFVPSAVGITPLPIIPLPQDTLHTQRTPMAFDSATAPQLRLDSDELTLENLDEKTKSYFSKQDAIPSLFQIEGFLFQGVSVFLEGRQKEVEKAWKSYLYNTNRIKLKAKKAKSFFNRKKTPYWKASEVGLTNVTHRIGDIITVFQRENGLIKMTVIFKLGYNTSINKENYPEANSRLIQYVEHFSQVNFREYYGEHLKELVRSIKSVDREIKKEKKALRKLEKKHARSLKKKDEQDTFLELSISIQKELIRTLQEERNQYEILIVKYKNRNSQIRSKLMEEKL